jgi:hypothetical protein
MSSERINPPLEGFPLVEDFDKLMERWESGPNSWVFSAHCLVTSTNSR